MLRWRACSEEIEAHQLAKSFKVVFMSLWCRHPPIELVVSGSTYSVKSRPRCFGRLVKTENGNTWGLVKGIEGRWAGHGETQVGPALHKINSKCMVSASLRSHSTSIGMVGLTIVCIENVQFDMRRCWHI